MASTWEEKESRLIALVGSWNAQDLWPLMHLVLPFWLLLAVAPRWKWTPTLTLISPLVHSALYTICSVKLLLLENRIPDFMSIQGVMTIFDNPNVVFVGWLHYVAFDILVGRFIAMDAIHEQGVSNIMYALIIVPCLFMTLNLGPTGFLLYLSVRATILVPRRQQQLLLLLEQESTKEK